MAAQRIISADFAMCNNHTVWHVMIDSNMSHYKLTQFWFSMTDYNFLCPHGFVELNKVKMCTACIWWNVLYRFTSQYISQKKYITIEQPEPPYSTALVCFHDLTFTALILPSRELKKGKWWIIPGILVSATSSHFHQLYSNQTTDMRG